MTKNFFCRYQQSWQGLGRCDAIKLLETLSSSNYTGTGSGGTGTGSSSGSSGGDDGSGTTTMLENACLLGAQAMNLLHSNGLV